jgi:hypothetical protein
MANSDPFHEAKESLQTVRREYTATSSINAATAYTVAHTAETAVRNLFTFVTGADFPYEQFPHHVPERIVAELGLLQFYSPEMKAFLGKMTGYALQDVRFENTRAFQDHTDIKATGRGKYLVDGLTQFVEATVALQNNAGALRTIKSWKP